MIGEIKRLLGQDRPLPDNFAEFGYMDVQLALETSNHFHRALREIRLHVRESIPGMLHTQGATILFFRACSWCGRVWNIAVVVPNSQLV